MDLSEYLKLGLKDLCKAKQTSRVVQIRHLRQQNRDKYMMSQRQIVESVENTPEVKAKVRRPILKQPVIEVEQPKVNKRMEALLLWRAEKAKKMEMEKNSNKSKPVFKVSKVVAQTKLEDIYPKKASQTPSFVGSTHSFKPPKNIKPIAIHQTTISQNTRSKTQTSKSKNDTAIKKAPIKRTVTARAKDTKGKTNNKILDKIIEFGDALKVSTAINTLPEIIVGMEESPKKMNKTPNRSTRMKKSRKNRENETPKHPSKKRNTETTTPKENTLQVMEVTPQKSPNELPNNEVVYVSPFVTIARGKKMARDEYKSRSSMGGILAGSPDFTGPKAAAKYFYNLKAEQIVRLQGLIEEWTKYSEHEDLPEGAEDIINATIGQTNLLLNKKMERFQQLIDNCENQNTDPLVNATDLHGYWDVVTIQVDSIDKRYENLVRMRDNGWEEILPIPKRVEEVAVPRPKKKVAVKKKKTDAQGSSKLRGAIRLARQKQQMASSEGSNCFDGGFFSIQSPKKSPAKTRKSLLKSVLSSAKGTPKHSPGLMMMKVAHNIKSIKKDTDSGSKSTGKKLKTVLFADEVMDCNGSSTEEDKENLEEITAKQETPRSKRQSVRLSSRSKLF
ncbi:PREDICTED: guanylate kinase-associated protein mars [Nicrophorus vespilloides]|uniref:Guanylate kinase-associated protein mars n=1 Tax=Nicrophorus vespilloides TaxID=110193 RepID=A0ABM1N4Q0_NICVS|nr:PREDICTED: guanylate kinase-associated protein mars [Nicrophorus vespilloides]XP_017781800.1 PREDICTED: guanylate kinase-associated protein mars [Nicrophorus vespilloides]XP_017781801.1 PREDICTED: guanylate kinase-associated protein mars [Nicrophorus vespilloides]